MAEKKFVVPEILPILPVRDTVLFPGAVLPLTVGRESSLALVNSLQGEEKFVGVVAQLDPRVEDPAAADLHQVGTLAKVHKTVKMPNGNVVIFLEGLQRIQVVELIGLRPFLRARVEAQPDIAGEADNELEALHRNAQELFRDVVSHSPQLSDDLQSVAMNIEDPGRLADFIAGTLPSLPTLLRQELIETPSVRKRLDMLIRELSKELEVLELRSKIQEQVQEQVSQNQREYLLREQMKAIQKELGESDDSMQEIDELRKKVEEAGMPAEAKKECERELKRLAKMTPASAEYMVSRTYLEWMTSLPWSKSSGSAEIDIPKAHQILDEDHYDLEKVKERILDYLAVKKLQPGMKGPILCFVGPPGVDAGRGGQARPGFPRRSVIGPDGSPRPGAKQHVPRPLSGCAVRLVEGAVHCHGELDGSDPGTVARPHGDHRIARIHGRRETPHCAQIPDPEAGHGARPKGGRTDRLRGRRTAGNHPQLYAGSGRAQPRA